MPQYRKISANDIFNGTAFTGPGHVILLDRQNRIVDLVTESAAGDGVEFFEGIICPGFVNTHCHIELSHMKGRIPQQTGLVNFVQSVMKYRYSAEVIKQNAMTSAKDELYNSGTSAIADICNTTDSIELKKQGDICWHNFIEISGFVSAGAEKRYDEAKDLQKIMKNVLPQFKTTLSPHSPYSVSKKLFELINNSTAGETISIHNQETEAEAELYQKGEGKFLSLYKNFGIDISSFAHTGKSSFETWLPYFNKNQKILCVHNTFIQQSDLNLLKVPNFELSTLNLELFFCLCPQANLYIENKLPPVKLLMENNVNITLGTDSYASNTSLNIFEEIKTLRTHFPVIPVETMLQWATSNGAKALGIDDRFGYIAKGMTPGIVLLDKNLRSSKRI